LSDNVLPLRTAKAVAFEDMQDVVSDLAEVQALAFAVVRDTQRVATVFVTNDQSAALVGAVAHLQHDLLTGLSGE
jgi:hypothetical protein